MAELTMSAARTICDAAIKHAEEHGWKISVVVLDAGGNIMQLSRMDGCNFLSPDIARGKAYGAAAWRIPSGELAQRFSQVATAGPGMVAASGQRAVFVQGALPIWDGNTFLGSAGASGVRSNEDEDCVRAGIVAAGLRAEPGAK